MSITPERLDELALEVAERLCVRLDNACGCPKCRERDDPPVIKSLARALLAAVEAELKPVAWLHTEFGGAKFFNFLDQQPSAGWKKEAVISIQLIKKKS